MRLLKYTKFLINDKLGKFEDSNFISFKTYARKIVALLSLLLKKVKNIHINELLVFRKLSTFLTAYTTLQNSRLLFQLTLIKSKKH